MLLDSSHRGWVVASLILFVLALAVYIPYARASLHGPSGGSALGLTYGVTGLALMLYAGLLGARRQIPTWRLGRATTWMRGHLWLGLLSYALIAFHSGFQLGGALTVILMLLFTIVILSGIYGVLLQQFLPRAMLTNLPLETVYEQIDSVVAQLRDEADELVAVASGAKVPAAAEAAPASARRGGGGLQAGQTFAPPLVRARPTLVFPLSNAAPLRDIYLSDIRPYLGHDLPGQSRLGSAMEATALFSGLRARLASPLHSALSELESICDERRQLAHQKRLHHWLHGWLLVHVPLSMALILLSVVHALVSVRY
ncbi:MAG: hypothetical protein ACREKS_13715 [Candidatus Rokuibacteriota bacterium]